MAGALRDANLRVIDAVAGVCPAVKPQTACYEAYGAPGWQALVDTVAHARSAGLVVILDAKRGDIGSTALHYGQMAFGGAPIAEGEQATGVGAHWVTVNGYLGDDAVHPILDAAESTGGGGVFVLVKTSNPGSGDIQDVAVHGGDGDTVAEHMADMVTRIGSARIGDSGLSDVGAVVAATYPGHAEVLRSRMPDSMFLVPGYGAQGATAADATAGARPDGRGILVSSSRAILGAWRTTGTNDIGSAARTALDAMNRDLEAARR